MDKLNSLEDFSFKNKDSNQNKDVNNESTFTNEKVLCNHCGRTANNGIRCLGICVSDNDY